MTATSLFPAQPHGCYFDVVVAIWTSRKSANVIAGLRQAKSMSLVTVALGGQGGGDMAGLADHLLEVPLETTERITLAEIGCFRHPLLATHNFRLCKNSHLQTV